MTPRQQVWPTLLVLLAVWVCVNPSLAQEVETLQKGVVKIRATPPEKSAQTGTGFIVRRGADVVYIVTASHVVEGARDVEVEFFSQRNRLMPAKLLQQEGGDEQGLAALAVQGNIPADMVVLKMNRGGLLRAGDPVTTIGFPNAGGPWAVTNGEIVGRKAKSIVFSGAIEKGNSGGPLIHEGQVIGVVTQTQSPFSYAAPTVIAQYVLESWGVRFGDQLRSKPATIEPGYVVQMIREKGFNHPGDMSKEGGSGYVRGNFQHEYEVKTFKGSKVVVDHTTDLTWQQSGSVNTMAWEEAHGYIDELNKERYAGFADWRLPTVEELASLLEPIGENEGLYIDAVFDKNQSGCWSADKSTIDRATSPAFYIPTVWAVDYKRGTVLIEEATARAKRKYARAVRLTPSGMPPNKISEPPPDTKPNASPLANTEIAFASDREGNWDIWVMKADGTNPRRLTNSPAAERSPLWSPDGTKIAFVSSVNNIRDIYVMNADGSDPKRLTDSELGLTLPAWSPDGTKIAFSSILGCVRNDFVMRADGTDRLVLNTEKARGGCVPWEQWRPSWSSDGAKIALPSNISLALDVIKAIHVINADGTNPETYTPLGDRHGYGWWVSWSPDGTKIGFVSKALPSGRHGIHVMNTDGSNLKRLGEVLFDTDTIWPAWSPDGTKIAFTGAEHGRNSEIYVIDVDGTERRLTNTPAQEGRPAWSPDGTKLVFASRRSGNWEIYTMNADGTESQRLTDTAHSEGEPTWSPLLKSP